MKNKKETAPTTEKERENFWLEIGPASAYYGTDSYETAKENGDASPDGKARGFEGAEPKVSPKMKNIAIKRSSSCWLLHQTLLRLQPPLLKSYLILSLYSSFLS